MLTFFTTAKPFAGHSGVIQRNALKSWTLLHPDVEIILFGEDEGAAEVARELGIRHEPHTEKNELGTNRVDYMFHRAQEIARNDLLCYANCDIIFLPDFLQALDRMKKKFPRFLLLGRRWDTEVNESIDFSAQDWAYQMRSRAVTENKQRPPWFIDYFAFSPGVFGKDIPPLLIGRAAWDNWMVWKGIESGNPVIDASASVFAIHQNHDYLHHPMGKAGIYDGEEAKYNFKLAGGWKHMRIISDAPLLLSSDGLKSNWRRFAHALQRNPTLPWYADVLATVWH
ncbi:MAG: hypothetical protein ACRD51_05190, partial [Candidatus Acidiferrum sp.]